MDDFETVKAEIEERDYRDKNRKISPLVLVKDAVYINSDHLTAMEVADKIISIIEQGEK